MSYMIPLPQRSVIDQAIEVLLIALCFTASIYGLALLFADFSVL